MLSTDVNDYKKFSHWDTDVAQFVAVARQNGIEGSDEDLYDFIRMVYKNGWDKKSIDEVVPKERIVEEIDLRVGELAQRDGLDDDQVERLAQYLEDNADAFRETEDNVRYAHDFVYNAVLYYRNYLGNKEDIIADIAEEIYDDFIKKNGMN